MMDRKLLIIITLVAVTVVVLTIAIAVPVALQKRQAEMSSLEKAKQWMSETPLIDG